MATVLGLAKNARREAIAALLPLLLVPSILAELHPSAPNDELLAARPRLSAVALRLPTFSGSTGNLGDISRYQRDLERFRTGKLERYNGQIRAHIAALKEFDKRVERMRASRNIARFDYNSHHDYVARELRMCAGDGLYTANYRHALAEYREEARWAKGERRRLEKGRVTF